MIYGLDYGELSSSVGENLHRRPPDNFVVEKFREPIPTREQYRKLIDGVVEGRDEPWMNWAQIYAFFSEVDSWVLKQFKQHSYEFGVSLHSVCYQDWSPEDEVDFVMHPRFHNPSFVQVVNEPLARLHAKYGKFAFDVFDEERGPAGPYDMVLVLMSHHPRCLEGAYSKNVTLAIRDFCSELIQRY